MKGTHNIGDVYTQAGWGFQKSCLDIMLKNKNITFGNTYRLEIALLKIISYIQKCMDLLSIKHKASAFHKLFNSIQTDVCKALRIIWQRDLGCPNNDDGWLKILSHNKKH